MTHQEAHNQIKSVGDYQCQQGGHLQMSEAKCSQVHRLVGRIPSCWEGWNRAMRGAYLNGAKAAHDGQSESACPYQDHRKDCGRLTWSRAFIRSWEDGHRDAIKHIQANKEITCE
jgi:ribosome modulation factor